MAVIEFNSFLQPERGWEVDTMHLEQQIDASTAALVVSNPSNPCGSVYSRQHLRDILQVARAKFVPVIADEIYEHMVSMPNAPTRLHGEPRQTIDSEPKEEFFIWTSDTAERLVSNLFHFHVFPGQTFHPLASVSDDVPILACSGITKLCVQANGMKKVTKSQAP